MDKPERMNKPESFYVSETTPCQNLTFEFLSLAEPSVRYGYSEEEERCIRFEFTGCGGNENNFETLLECEAVCVDPCTLQPDAGIARELYTSKEGKREYVSCQE